MNAIAIQRPLNPTAQFAQSWRQALPALVLLLAWIVFLYRDSGFAMVTIWARSETFTHAFLVAPITLWLVWRQRGSIAAHTPQPRLGVCLLVAGAGFAWLLGDLAAINAVTQLALVTLVVLTVPAVLGLSITRLIIFPLAYLFFAVPIGEFVMPQLMEWTANFTVFALRLTGIPVYREGLQFVIPTGNWSVVEACSGVRYLIASVTVGTLFAYLNYQSNSRRILFVIVSIVVPVIANWMRAYLIVMLGHLSSNKLAIGVDHLIYGWLFFGIVIMLMFIIGARWAEPEKAPTTSSCASGATTSRPGATKLRAVTACFAALVALPQLASWSIDRGESLATVRLVAPATLAGNWQAFSPKLANFKPAFDNPSAEVNQSYVSQGQVVGLYLAYYQHQDYRRKLVSSNNVLVPSGDLQWARMSTGTRLVTFNDHSVAVKTAELRQNVLPSQDNPSRLLVWQIYWINGSLTANDYLAKFYGALSRLTGRGDEAAVIVIYTPREGQASSAEAVLEAFVSSNYARINALLLNAKQSK